MIKGFMTFFIVFSIIFFGVLILVGLTKKDWVAVFKHGMFAAAVAALTCAFLGVIVFLF